MPSPFVMFRRALPVLVMLLVCLMAQPRQIGAHADLESSNPPAGGTVAALPAKLSLTFAEEVETRFSGGQGDRPGRQADRLRGRRGRSQ